MGAEDLQRAAGPGSLRVHPPEAHLPLNHESPLRERAFASSGAGFEPATSGL
jgi:hypothetical protein